MHLPVLADEKFYECLCQFWLVSSPHSARPGFLSQYASPLYGIWNYTIYSFIDCFTLLPSHLASACCSNNMARLIRCALMTSSYNDVTPTGFCFLTRSVPWRSFSWVTWLEPSNACSSCMWRQPLIDSRISRPVIRVKFLDEHVEIVWLIILMSYSCWVIQDMKVWVQIWLALIRLRVISQMNSLVERKFSCYMTEHLIFVAWCKFFLNLDFFFFSKRGYRWQLFFAPPAALLESVSFSSGGWQWFFFIAHGISA